MNTAQKNIPNSGLKGMRRHFKNDAVAAISVALVALPLSLAIAIAAGLPAISGIITAIVGGIVTTFFRSGAVTINGPAAGLIGVMLAGLAALDDGSGTLQAFRYLLAATIVAGGLQVLIGILKFGKIAEIFPATVIQGILASIGIIIFAKQMHVAMGTHSDAENTIGILQDIFYKIPDINPYIAVISGLGIILLLFHSKISYKVFHFIPAPVWVLAISVPIVLLYGYWETNNIQVLGSTFVAPENYLIAIPDNIWDGMVFPDFSVAYTGTFWMVVISIHLISSVITLAGAKAVDKLDPYKRKTDLNKDLVGVGISSMVSGAIGGLPVLAVIVRSTVNVHNNAKTKWSNFYHGLYILILLVLLTPVIQLFPKAALAAVLVVTGIKLASPRVFKDTYNQGLEQFIFLIATIVITLYENPLTGLLGGILITLLAHLLISRLSVRQFFQMVFRSGTHLKKNDDGTYTLKIKGVANFLTMLKLIQLMDSIPKGTLVKVDLSKTRVIDLTYQEKLMDFRRLHRMSGGKVQIFGLDEHIASSTHKLALKSLILPNFQKPTARQQRIKKIAAENGWMYTREEQVETTELSDFNFFNMRPIETKSNVIVGHYEDHLVDWEVCDLIFDEGAMLSKEVFHTTIQVIHLPRPIPTFDLEKEGTFDKLIERVLHTHKDIDFDFAPDFSNRYKLTSKASPEDVKAFFTPALIDFLETEEIYHIESTGNNILIFKHLKYAKASEIKNMIRFSENLVQRIVPKKKD